MQLQRLVVRMLYDPKLIERVCNSPSELFRDMDLTEREKVWLGAMDFRVFSADVFRRDRGLKALLDEYPCAGVLIFHAAGNLLGMDAFFSSEEFHDCIQNRKSLALSFGGFLQGMAPRFGPETLASLNIEFGLAGLRRSYEGTRASESGQPADDMILSPGVALLESQEGSLAHFQELRDRMCQRSSDWVEALLDPGLVTLSLPAITPSSTEFLLLSTLGNDVGEISIELLPEALFRVLKRAKNGCSREDLLDELRVHGAEEGEDMEIFGDLIGDGLLLAWQ